MSTPLNWAERVDDGEVVLYIYAKRKAVNIYDVDANINYWQNFKNDLRLKANVSYGSSINPDSFKSTSHSIKPDFIFTKMGRFLLTVTGKYNFNIKGNNAKLRERKMVYDYTSSDDLSSNLVYYILRRIPQESRLTLAAPTGIRVRARIYPQTDN